MYLLKPLMDEVSNSLLSNSIDEAIDLRISNLDGFDYQINNLVKYQNHQNIELIKTNISTLLDSSDLISNFTFANNMFINLTINAGKLLEGLKNVEKNIQIERPKKVIVDYGGPNIGKPLHVGHLRPLNIGRSVYLTNEVVGNTTYSDIHLGDWGMPVAQIITFCDLENIDIKSLSIEMLEKIYPDASNRYTNDAAFKQIAQETNKKLSSNVEETKSKWSEISNTTLSSLKETLLKLDHEFDLWWGESTVNDLIPEMLDVLKESNKIEKDGDAYISAEITDPRILITKSDGSYLYITTDLATVIKRNEEIPHDRVLYVTDNRQKLHFKQLFQSLKFFEFPNKEYEHIGFGTINDSNGNPLKTRDGGNLKLADLYNQSFEYIQKINNDLPSEDIHCLTNTVLTFSDLITNRKTDYKFDLEKFTNVSGKTGIYVQYAQVRATRLMESIKLDQEDLNKEVRALNSLERSLVIGLGNIEFFLDLSLKNSEPHHLANYLYDISYLFNSFYQDLNIKNMQDGIEKNQKIFITSLFIQYSHLVMKCLGIKPVNKM